MTAISINEISAGIGLLIDGEIYQVSEYHHVKPGKGSAFVRVRIRNIKTDAVLERTYRTAERLEEVSLDENRLQYLYNTGDAYHFMDHSTYEEVVVAKEKIGAMADFLLENLEVVGLYSEGKFIKVDLPNFIIAQIQESEPGVRGDSTKAGTKPAKIETGANIQVPLFINNGDWVKIDTRSGQYVERVQK